jgi:hypothetical protein
MSVISPELVSEIVVNGNSFLTSFMKLSRQHEKVLLGMEPTEDINQIDVLRVQIDPLSSSMTSLSRKPSQMGSRSRTAPGKSRNSSTPSQSNRLPTLNESTRDAGTENPYAFLIRDTPAASRPGSPKEDFPFNLESPRKNVLQVNTKMSNIGGQASTTLPAVDSHRRPSMLSKIFSGVNPWTTSFEDLGAVSPAMSPMAKGRKEFRIAADNQAALNAPSTPLNIKQIRVA